MGAGTSSSGLWRDVMQQTTVQTKKVQAELMQKVKADFKDQKTPDEAEIMKMATDAAKQFEEENKKMLERVWKAYDVNGDGELDTEECKKLVKEMLIEQQKFAPKLIDMMLDSSIQLSLDLLSGMNLTPEELKQATRAVKDQMAVVKQESRKAVAEMTAALLKDSDNLASALFTKMDTDRSGKVSRDEFFDNYARASKEIVSIEEMVGKLGAK